MMSYQKVEMITTKSSFIEDLESPGKYWNIYIYLVLDMIDPLIGSW